jgi:protein involved in polysaccharide export with SLBB domain
MKNIIFLLLFSLNSILVFSQIAGLGQMNQLMRMTDPNAMLNQLPKQPTQSQSSMLGTTSLNAAGVLSQVMGQTGESTNTASTTTGAASALGLDEASLMMLLQTLAQQEMAGAETTQSTTYVPDTLRDPVFPKSSIFGHDFFGRQKLELYTKSTDLKAPDNYILDTGDELNVAVWGFSDYSKTLIVESDGYITIQDYGRFYVRGLTFEAVRKSIIQKLRTFINLQNSDVAISLNHSRTITVNIVGEVRSPGTYQIPAINSVFNALNAAKGVSESGSVRAIEVRRNGKTIKTFDTYDFLLGGKTEQEFYLQEGDFIYVPFSYKIITVEGEIRRPMKYELLPNEGTNSLLYFSGGLLPTAYTKIAQLKRYKTNKVEVYDLNLDEILSSGNDYDLMNLDKIVISTIPDDFQNFVSIKGSVRVPGKYELRDGMRVSDVVKLADGIHFNTYIERGYILRTLDDLTTVIKSFNLKDIILNENSAENLLLQKMDVVEIFSKRDFLEKFSVEISGSVLKPITKEYSEGLTLNDLVFYAGGFKREAANTKIDIFRLKNIDKEVENTIPERVMVKTVTIDNNLEIDAESKAFLLKPMDHVIVRKTHDYDPQTNVTLTGEVMYPGVYPILRKDERLTDLIKRAGGLTPFAHVDASTLKRVDKALGPVILELKQAFKDTASRANYILKPDDLINIPSINQLVSLSGAIRYPEIDTFGLISGKYVPSKRAKFYVKKYGAGFDDRAKKTTTVVLNPNGSAVYTKKFPWFGRYPKVAEGAKVQVDYKPRKEKREKLPRDPINWNIVLPSIIVSATSTVTTVVLLLTLTK